MTDTHSEDNEKRLVRRIRSEYPFTYQVTAADGVDSEPHEATSTDISIAGMQFHTTEKFPVGVEIAGEIAVTPGCMPIAVSGRVAHIAERTSAGYLVGLRFERMSEEALQVLVREIRGIDLVALLELMMQRKASDLHLTVDEAPTVRIQRELFALGQERLDGEQMRRMVYSLMDEGQIAQFERDHEFNYALSLPHIGRWRVNVHRQQGQTEATYRAIALDVPTITGLGLPEIVADLARGGDGLVIVAGPTGVGKSTTLAAMVDVVNREFRKVIVTLEDPIEYMHKKHRSLIKQREVGSDTYSFATGLKNALRQDPDVIFIGEVRDVETLAVALNAAETGHQVLTSLHTSTAEGTINRILGMYPPDQRQEAAVQLASSLKGIICQRLIKRADGEGLAVASEVLIGTPAVRAVIRDQRINQIPTLIQTGAQFGMHNMDSSLQRLVRSRKISEGDAVALAGDPVALQKQLETLRQRTAPRQATPAAR